MVSAKLPLLSSQAVPLTSAGCPRKRFKGSKCFYALQYRPVASSTQLSQISAELNLHPNVARQGSKPTACVDMSSVTRRIRSFVKSRKQRNCDSSNCLRVRCAVQRNAMITKTDNRELLLEAIRNDGTNFKAYFSLVDALNREASVVLGARAMTQRELYLEAIHRDHLCPGIL
jgi:hypothetical protein